MVSEHIMIGSKRLRTMVVMMLEENRDLHEYLTLNDLHRSGSELIVRDYTFAGSGMKFLIDFLLSVLRGTPVEIARLTVLDRNNRILWAKMCMALVLDAVQDDGACISALHP